ncbi:cAMP-dependent protein kinase catalytic subunit alpha-like [Prorops nasuta]|uniref:cAMP-dependent protein kinase catalytic subunit alpha-like n=1 Tax=Prorops nasuta TaxID=863751 RepID=UPI0034CD7BB3
MTKDYKETLDKLKKSFLEKWGQKLSANGKLDEFECFRTVGTGAFGRVILVKNKKHSEYYAMKILDKENIVKQKQVPHTLNEIKLLRSMNFPFVVYMEFYFTDYSYIYMVLPFISGGEMFSHLRKMGKFDEPLAKFYGAQVTLALEYMHHCGLVYRDLKPENILIDSDGYIKLTDFGFGKMIDGRTWTLCGTPEYLAPEIILSKGYGFAVDWWSFGVLVYEMNAGYPPFSAQNPMKIYEKVVAGKFKFAGHFNDNLKDILTNLLQVDLTRRFGNLKDGCNDIKNHAYFKSINFLEIYRKEVKPTFIPKSGEPGDTSNFDIYDEDTKKKVETEDRWAKEFAEF